MAGGCLAHCSFITAVQAQRESNSCVSWQWQVVGQRSAAAPQLFKHKEFNFEKLGIGGLDAQFDQIFRRAFASRVFPPEMVSGRLIWLLGFRGQTLQHLHTEVFSSLRSNPTTLTHTHRHVSADGF